MKRSIYILTMLFFSNMGFSQVNTYLNNNPIWEAEMHAYSGWDCTGTDDVYNYYINGDSVIGAFTYKKVYKKGVFNQINSSCLPINITYYNNTLPSFLLRSLDKQMFVYLLDEQTEYLLYDFDLEIGDTLPETYTYNASNTSGVFTVSAIDSVETPNGFLKKFSLLLNGTNYQNDALYEGAGSTGGLIEPIFPNFLSGYHQLNCYSLIDTTYFPVLNESASCNFNASLFEMSDEIAHSVAPNPFSVETEITLGESINGELGIYNLQGKLIEQIEFIGSTVKIQKGNKGEGVYFYRITENERPIATGKLIIN